MLIFLRRLRINRRREKEILLTFPHLYTLISDGDRMQKEGERKLLICKPDLIK